MMHEAETSVLRHIWVQIRSYSLCNVQNPIHTLTELVAGMHDADGHITIDGFYE